MIVFTRLGRPGLHAPLRRVGPLGGLLLGATALALGAVALVVGLAGALAFALVAMVFAAWRALTGGRRMRRATGRSPHAAEGVMPSSPSSPTSPTASPRRGGEVVDVSYRELP